jgi:phage terminase large subunit-like protein
VASITYGDQMPRIEAIPQYVTSSAADAIELASVAGLDLDPWQQYTLTGGLGRKADGRWSAFEVKILVPRQNGKGSILEARELAGLYLFSTDRLIIHTAHEHKTASEHYRRVLFLIENTPDLDKRVARQSSAYGREFIELKAAPTIISGSDGRQIRRKERSRLIFIARTGGSGRGFTCDCLVYDEDMALVAGQVGSSLPSLSARPNPQVWYAGSAGNKNSTQVAHIRRRALAGGSNSLAYYEWSIDWHDDYCSPDCKEHDDPYDIRSVAKANPALGRRVTADFVQAERDAMPEVEFNRERLSVGEYPAPLDGWLVVPKKWFEATKDSAEEPPRVRHPIFAIDVAPNRESGAIAVAGLRPDESVGLQVIDHRDGATWIVARAKAIQERWKPERWIVDKRAAAGALLTELEQAGLPVETMQATDVAHACGQIYDSFRDDTIRHYGQASLRAALAGVDKRELSDAWAFDRRNAGVDISPLMATTFALWGYQKFGMQEDYDIRDSVHFDIDEIKRLCRAGVYGPDDIKRLYESGLIDNDGLEALSDAGIPFHVR